MHRNASCVHLTLHKIVWQLQYDCSYLLTACVYKLVMDDLEYVRTCFNAEEALSEVAEEIGAVKYSVSNCELLRAESCKLVHCS